MRTPIASARRIVVKVGSSLVTNDGRGLDAAAVAAWAAQIAELGRYDSALLEKPRWLVLNKMDLVPEDERKKRVREFVKAYGRNETEAGRVFPVTAINGEGCRELVLAIQEWLDAHPSPLAEAPDPEGEAEGPR